MEVLHLKWRLPLVEKLTVDYDPRSRLVGAPRFEGDRSLSNDKAILLLNILVAISDLGLVDGVAPFYPEEENIFRLLFLT